ncbi:MAG: helicase, partial [Bacteroidales bacterium]|nr:helicase [Bacteroidales bacterium]
MSTNNLFHRLFELETQNLTLKNENEELRKKLNLPSLNKVDMSNSATMFPKDKKTIREQKPSENQPTINKFSTPDEKIALFMSLFRGRSDVFAKRCYSRQYDSAYYIPACRNEFVRGVCNRPKVKCKKCKNRDLLPLNKDVINSHLRDKDENGHGIVGIYPLLPDDTCLFLAIDFDDAEWQKDIAAFRLICRELNVPIAIERSRSGNGAHAWLFFENA